MGTVTVMPMKFSGHETFACRYVWLPKALQAIQSDPRVFADEDEAIVELGVGKNMVRSIRFWVEASGMAKPAQQGLEPTKLGLLIFGAKGWDPFIEDIQTLWLIHWNLTTQIEHPLFAWEFLFNRWHEPEFTESAVLKAFAKETDGLSKRLSSVTLQQHFQVFLHTYVPARGQKEEISEDNWTARLPSWSCWSRYHAARAGLCISSGREAKHQPRIVRVLRTGLLVESIPE